MLLTGGKSYISALKEHSKEENEPSCQRSGLREARSLVTQSGFISQPSSISQVIIMVPSAGCFLIQKFPGAICTMHGKP